MKTEGAVEFPRPNSRPQYSEPCFQLTFSVAVVLWVRFPEVPVTVITYVPVGVPEDPTGGLGFTDEPPPPPQPTLRITSKNAGAARAMRFRPVSL